MIELVAFIFITQFVALVFYYSTDRELKFLARGGIQQHEQLTLTKWKYLFVFSKRKEGIITKHIFICMIAYYIVNGAGFAVLLFLYFSKNGPLIGFCCAFLVFANIGLLFILDTYPKLTPEQKKMRLDYMEQLAQEYKIKRQEKKQNKLKLKGK